MDSFTLTKWESSYSNSQMKSLCLQVFKHWFSTIIFTTGFAGQGVLNMDPTVWLDGVRPANTCIPPSFWGNASTQLCRVHTKKYVCDYIKKDVCKYKKIIRLNWHQICPSDRSHRKYDHYSYHIQVDDRWPGVPCHVLDHWFYLCT
jgi:hypothetical protein